MTPKALYESQMRHLVREANDDLPRGWRIRMTPLRSFPKRNHWRFEAIGHGKVEATWDRYQVAASLPEIVAWIDQRATRVTVTTDGDGWVQSIEDVPA